MRKRKISPFGIIVGFLLGVYTLLIILMFLWALNSSLRTVESFDQNVLWLTKDFAFDNYVTAFLDGFLITVTKGLTSKDVYIEGMFLNSIIYCGGSALCQAFCTCIVAYLIVKYDCVFGKIMHNIIIITMILPIVGALPSQIQITDWLHIRGTFVGAFAMKFGFTNMYYLIFYSAFKTLPWSYAESAFIDGANHFQVFFKIMLPLVSTLFGVAFLLFFIEYWNDYQVPMLFLENHPTLSWGLFVFFKSYDQTLSTPVIKIAGGVIVLLPLLALFFVFRKKLMGNLTDGGVKS